MLILEEDVPVAVAAKMGVCSKNLLHQLYTLQLYTDEEQLPSCDR